MNPLLKTNSAISSRVFYYFSKIPEVDGGGLKHFAIGQRVFTSVPIPYLVSNILNLLNHNFGYWKAFNGKWKVDQESERTTADAESESVRFDQISCSLCVSRHALELKENCFFFVRMCRFSRRWLNLSFSACPLCTRLGLQGQLNTTLTTLKDAQETADTVSNLEELWPELINVEDLISEAQVRFSCFRIYSETH